MTAALIVRQRLRTQRLDTADFASAEAVVAALCAVQSQDYSGARWALGLRASGLTGADVDDAFNTGAILRTHVMRPTWHFVSPVDIRWLLGLTAPRVHTVCGSYFRKLGLDAPTLAKSRRVFERALRDGRYLTRLQLQAALKRAGLEASGVRLAFFMMHAELEQLVCSGPRLGKQFTYALLDERAPGAVRLGQDEALARLTQRYFTGHGPATARDFSWWSGLSMAQVKRGLEIERAALCQELADGLTYWSSREAVATAHDATASRRAHLLPNYDESLIAYKDRGPTTPGGPPNLKKDLYAHHLLVDGRIAGSWRHTSTKARCTIEIATYEKPTRVVERALMSSADRYGVFVNQPTTVSFNIGRR